MALRLLLPLFATVHAAPAASWRCVFFPGAGWVESKPATTVDTDGSFGHAGYWGGAKFEKDTPYCASRLFVHQDTKHRGWDNVELQQAFCDASVGQESQNSSVIDNTIIFTHSMSNNIFAAALKNKLCSMGPRAKWYSLSALWGGSQAAGRLVSECSKPDTSYVKWMVKKYCSEEVPGALAEAYASMVPGYKGLDELVPVAITHVSGAVCGTSPFGLSSRYSMIFKTMSGLVGYDGENDGMVGTSSCELPGKTYTGTYRNDFYQAAINHADSTCQNGDGYWGDDRKPCAWFRHLESELLPSPMLAQGFDESAEVLLLV